MGNAKETDNSQQRHETMAHLGCLIYPCAYTVDGNLQHTVGNNPLIDKHTPQRE